MAILNGKSIKDNKIDPDKHKYIGMFRRPYSHFINNIRGYLYCPCGRVLKTMEENFAHYQMGHWDEPQYKEIQEKK
jgi:hypothetical protein